MKVVLDVETERKLFEEHAFTQYLISETDARNKHDLTAKASGKLAPRFKPMMTVKLFCKRSEEEPDKYQLTGLDAAWWAWRQRAQLALEGAQKAMEDES